MAFSARITARGVAASLRAFQPFSTCVRGGISNKYSLTLADCHVPRSLEAFKPYSTSTNVVSGGSGSNGSSYPVALANVEGDDEPNEPYWQHIGIWSDIPEADFMSYAWQKKNTIRREDKLIAFLAGVLPDQVPFDHGTFKTRDEFLADVKAGMLAAPMSIRLTPHMLSVANWKDPVDDPIRRQFVPLKSRLMPDHWALTLDSLHEKDDSPVPGLVHRYPDKVLFLATSNCPVYCRFCTRSYAVGGNTSTVAKEHQRPLPKRWEKMFQYIEQNPKVQDVVVSGGDVYSLEAEDLRFIGERLLSIPNVKRFRLASKGLGVCPMRILDRTDGWVDTLIDLSKKGRKMGKQVALHTHINHPNEITWATKLAAQTLFEDAVVVRNQSVLLKGVNDNVETMSTLIRNLSDINIMPYYVYQADLVRGIEDLRTPVSTILHLEKDIRGTIAGFAIPSFVVDLPGGGGKRLAASYESYDEKLGESKFQAPGVTGDKVYTYYDPVSSAAAN